MPSKNQIALAVTGIYVIAILYWGIFHLGTIIFTVLAVLLGVIAYIVWRKLSSQ